MTHRLPIHRARSVDDPRADAHPRRPGDQNRDGRIDVRRELLGPVRGPRESMALTALVLLALTVASSVEAALIASEVADAKHGGAAGADSWTGLGVLIVAGLIGACTVPIAATLILRLLRVPRAGMAMLATILTVIADARGPHIVFGAPGFSVLFCYVVAIAVAAGWVGVLHPDVLRQLIHRH